MRNSDLPEKLPHARGDYKALLKEIDAFLEEEDTKRALKDDVFRVTTFRSNNRKVHQLMAALNQTQKLLVQENSDHGVGEISKRMEQIGLLLHGHEFRSDYKVIDAATFDPAIVDDRKKLQIHFAIAIELLMYRNNRRSN